MRTLHTVNFQLASTTHLVGTTLLILLLLVGISIPEAIWVVLVVLVQCIGGVLLWQRFQGQRCTDLKLVIGAGSTLGISLSTLSHQLLRSSMFSSVAWLLPASSALVLVIFTPDKFKSNVIQRTTSYGTTLCLVIIGLLDQWWWLFPVLILAAVFALMGKRPQMKKLFLFAVLPVVALSAYLRNVSSIWWIISNDAPYLESLSTSVEKFGPSGNISALGQSISYHWFSFAWVGLVSEVSAAGNWTVLTYVLPVVSCLVIALLVQSITLKLTSSRVSAIVAATSVLLLSDVVTTTSPSQLFAFAPMLVAAYLFIDTISSPTQVGTYVLTYFFVFITFGTKVSSGAVLVGAMFATTIFFNWNNYRRRFLFLFLLLFAVLVSYLYFFGTTRGINSLTLGPSNLGGLKLMGRALGGGRFHFFAELFAVLLFFFPILSGLILTVGRKKVTENRIPVFFLAFICLTGFLLGIGLDGVGTESYFLIATLPFSIMLVVVGLSQVLRTMPHLFPHKWTSLLALTGIIIGSLKLILIDFFSKHIQPSLIASSLPFILFYFSILLIGITNYWCLRKKPFRLISFYFIISLLLSSSLIGESVWQRIEFAKGAVTTQNRPDSGFDRDNYFAGSPSRIEALHWLRSNSPSDAVVATNRFCLSTTYCGPYKWFLASAISKRQMFIEGYYYSVGVYPEPDWAQKRIDVSERFSQQANASDLDYLKDEGVSYFIVDLEFVWSYKTQNWETSEAAQLKSWESYATTVFKNEEMAILKLN